MAPQTPSSRKQVLSESLFYMWRCVIAIAWTDGVLQPQERTYIDNVIANLDRIYGLDAAQKKIFQDDLKKPHRISDLLPRVTAPEDRASLIYFGDILAWADGQVTADEEDVLKKLHDDQMKKVDVDKLRQEVEADIASRRKERVAEMNEIHAAEQKKHPMFAALDRLMLRFGIDMLD